MESMKERPPCIIWKPTTSPRAPDFYSTDDQKEIKEAMHQAGHLLEGWLLNSLSLG